MPAEEETLPPYVDAKDVADSTHPQQEAQIITETTAQDDPDAQIVILAHLDRSKPKGKKLQAQCSEALLIPPTMTRQELMQNLISRTVKLAKPLKLKEDEDMKKRMYALMFIRGKGAGAQFVCVLDEENWQACRMLLSKHEDASLCFYVYGNEPAEGGGGGGERKAGKEKRSGKKCILQ